MSKSGPSAQRDARYAHPAATVQGEASFAAYPHPHSHPQQPTIPIPSGAPPPVPQQSYSQQYAPPPAFPNGGMYAPPQNAAQSVQGYAQAPHSQYPGYSAPQPQQQPPPAMAALPFGLGETLNSQLGRTLFDTAATRFAQSQREFLGETGGAGADHFLRIPKVYFAVSTSYVARKLLLLLFPLKNKTWTRRRLDEGGPYLPPREDLNAPDLYIPAMAFITYVLLVGFISGTAGTFTPDVMASTASLGLLVLSLEVLAIRLGLYLVRARPVPWLDLVAFRGYKFVGLTVVLLASALNRVLFWPVLLYLAAMMGIFLMRTYRKLVLVPSASAGAASVSAEDTAKKNYFLLGVAAIQFPIYWVLARRA
mmetsp:Transcript_11181/g.30066  ORF Transcript_11181/g.30066 Transcript_11181/m.30066 type:complete len:365 (+) Transcript_11181:53-1147(+)